MKETEKKAILAMISSKSQRIESLSQFGQVYESVISRLYDEIEELEERLKREG